MGLNRDNPLLNYPSPSEVKIYIGENNWIDDAYRVDYTLSNPKTPLYDYTSNLYKDVADGHSVVQGQIVINFRFPGYLKQALNERLKTDPGIMRSMNKAGSMFEDLAIGSASDKVRKLAGYKKLGIFRNAKQISNVLYGNNANPPVNQTLGNMTQTPPDKGFKILIKYGGEENLYAKVISGCHIIGEGQVISAAATSGGDLSSSGMPILEVYSFFARTVEDRFEEKALNASRDLRRHSSKPNLTMPGGSSATKGLTDPNEWWKL